MKLNKYKFDEIGFWEEVDSLSNVELSEIINSIGGPKLLHKKFLSKKYNSKYRHTMGISISEKDYACLIYAANIHLNDVYKGGYNLARLNDSGAYIRKNCRFIHCSENLKEMIPPPKTLKQTESGRRNIKKAASYLTKEMLSNAGKIWCEKYWKARELEFSERYDTFLVQPVDVEFINYPKFGWKARLARQFNVSKRIVDRFLRTNSDYVGKLKFEPLSSEAEQRPYKATVDISELSGVTTSNS